MSMRMQQANEEARQVQAPGKACITQHLAFDDTFSQSPKAWAIQ